MPSVSACVPLCAAFPQRWGVYPSKRKWSNLCRVWENKQLTKRKQVEREWVVDAPLLGTNARSAGVSGLEQGVCHRKILLKGVAK